MTAGRIRYAAQAAVAIAGLWTIPQAQGAGVQVFCSIPTHMENGVNALDAPAGAPASARHASGVIIDTGAAFVIIAKWAGEEFVADGHAQFAPDITVRLADGSTRRDRSVWLDRVTVRGTDVLHGTGVRGTGCKATATHVRATLGADDGSDDLLGLSFLNQFPFYGFRRGELLVQVQ